MGTEGVYTLGYIPQRFYIILVAKVQEGQEPIFIYVQAKHILITTSMKKTRELPIMAVRRSREITGKRCCYTNFTLIFPKTTYKGPQKRQYLWYICPTQGRLSANRVKWSSNQSMKSISQPVKIRETSSSNIIGTYFQNNY